MNPPFEFSKIQAWIREAGDIALRCYQNHPSQRRKSDKSPVTEADEAVEKFLIEKIERTYVSQGHALIAEESGGEWQGKEFVWAVDPIDGTRVFVNGLPLWAISIGLLRNGQAYRGVVYLPVLREIYYTNDEGAVFWNGLPLTGLLPTAWDRDSFIAVSSAAHRHFEIDFRRTRALGAIATHQVFVSRGAAVAALHRKAKVWDIAGAQAILAAAGGVAVYLDGTPLNMPEVLARRECLGAVLAGHPTIVEKLLPRIKPREKERD